MKSAYEIAMERLNQSSGPGKKLTKEQKSRLSEIDRKFDARSAAAKLGQEERLAKAASLEELQSIQAALASELQSLESQREREKDAIWDEA